MSVSSPTTPDVSVVMPVYNAARHLQQAVDSVLAQTATRWEIIVIDDGSTDGSIELLRPLGNDARIRIYQQARGGQAAARNLGIREARAPLVCFMDSDDIWVPHKLAEQLQIMENNPRIDILYGEEDVIDEEGRPIPYEPMQRHRGNITEALLRDNFVTIGTVIMKREHALEIGGFDQNVRHADDYDFWLRASVACAFEYHCRIWQHYRVHGSQLSSSSEARFASNRATLQRFFEANPQFATPALQRQTWSNLYARQSRHLTAMGRQGSAVAAAGRSIAADPVSARGWRAMLRAIKDQEPR